MITTVEWEIVSHVAQSCRAKPYKRDLPYVLTEVSIHAPRCRGAKRPEGWLKKIEQIVSIHAPRCRGAKLIARKPQARKEKSAVLREPRLP